MVNLIADLYRYDSSLLSTLYFFIQLLIVHVLANKFRVSEVYSHKLQRVQSSCAPDIPGKQTLSRHTSAQVIYRRRILDHVFKSHTMSQETLLKTYLESILKFTRQPGGQSDIV